MARPENMGSTTNGKPVIDPATIGSKDGFLLKADGSVTPLPPANRRWYTLTELQAVVGGDIETIRIGNRYMIVDEDGINKRKPKNQNGCLVYATIGGTNPIVGDVVVCPASFIR